MPFEVTVWRITLSLVQGKLTKFESWHGASGLIPMGNKKNDDFKRHIERNITCQLRIYYRNYYPGVLPLSQVTATHFKIRHP